MTDGDIRFPQLNIQQFSPVTYGEFSQHCGEELDFNLRNNNTKSVLHTVRYKRKLLKLRRR